MSAPELPRSVATGASGFVGRRLAAALGGRLDALALGRDDWREQIGAVRWKDAVVFHLAARVHQGGALGDALYERDNAEKTRALAEAAAAGGARRLVFLSTLKVNGEETRATPMRAGDTPRPQDAYARSKWRAEQGLAECAARTGLEVVVARSPLIVGPGAKGNLASLLALADTPWPLPFAAIDNRRTLIAVDDLVELLLRCARVPDANGRTFLAGDPDALATPRLVRVLREALGRPVRLFRASPALLESSAALLGLGDRMRRLTRSLEADVAETRAALDWKPRAPIDEALRAMAMARRKAA